MEIAEGKIPKRMAAGLDGVPVSLINELGHNTKEALLKAVENAYRTVKYRTVGEKVE